LADFDAHEPAAMRPAQRPRDRASAATPHPRDLRGRHEPALS
jgi:hypothetical protein